MTRSKARGLMLVCGALVAVLGIPSRSDACRCLDCLWPWNWGRSTMASTTYAPPYVAPAPAASMAPTYSAASYPSCVGRTCSYVPQTCYRTVYETVPTTTCRPITYRDPCNGCPVTCYRAVTSYARRARLVPYTTYRMVWSNVCTPVCPTYGTVTSSCPSCGIGATTTPAPSYSIPSTGQGTLTPMPSTIPSTTIPRTFEKSTPTPETRLKPIPDADIESKPPTEPTLIEPAGRSTSRPIHRTAYYQAASHQTVALPVDDGGWRASRD